MPVNFTLYQVDAFTDRVFGGNPAVICPLDGWPSDATLQAITREHNKYTAFFVANADAYDLRWFVPAGELELCGHATLASAHVVFAHLGHLGAAVRFHTKAGLLSVTREGDLLTIDFPAAAPARAIASSLVADALGETPADALKGLDILAAFESPEQVRSLAPDLDEVAALDCRGVIATAPAAAADEADFVLRFFAPGAGVPEDQATASAQIMLAPYWTGRLGPRRLCGRQLSPRGAELHCQVDGETVRVTGRAVTYQQATVSIGEAG
jgi:PhzF family phenazine biosynthesis protein